MNFPEIAMQQAPGMLNQYGGPLGLAGKLIGLGKEEIEAGVPWWTWLGIGILAGGMITYSSRHTLERILEK